MLRGISKILFSYMILYIWPYKSRERIQNLLLSIRLPVGDIRMIGGILLINLVRFVKRTSWFLLKQNTNLSELSRLFKLDFS